MELRLPGMETLARLVQLRKAELPMEVTPSGMDMPVRLEQP